MTKKRIMKRALEEVDKKNLSKFSEELKGVPALLFSKEEPFSLFNILKKSKTKTAAKPGQVALNDIVVKFDALLLNDERFSFIQYLSAIIPDSGEVGVMEYDIFKLIINRIKPVKVISNAKKIKKKLDLYH